MKTPVLIVNLKQYDQSLGRNSIKFAEIAKKMSDKHNVSVVIAPPAPMIDDTSSICLTMSQHIDPYEPGAHTGSLLAKHVKELGCIGTIINHSEKRISYENIEKCVELCKKHRLISVVCAKDNKEAGELAALKPDFIAVEPPELIGGDICVTTKPEVIVESVKAVSDVSPQTKVLCGAGVKHRDDVEKAIELGSQGILVASGVVKADDIENAMEDLVMGML
ncbi:MAG: triose-phosphate isomerase [Candidatus Aenigmarchaeota archaeon]|nr:triose-phosphate isomerase [Candidatus Aenigmarchaeota archaeon]